MCHDFVRRAANICPPTAKRIDWETEDFCVVLSVSLWGTDEWQMTNIKSIAVICGVMWNKLHCLWNVFAGWIHGSRYSIRLVIWASKLNNFKSDQISFIGESLSIQCGPGSKGWLSTPQSLLDGWMNSWHRRNYGWPIQAVSCKRAMNHSSTFKYT